MTLNFSFRDSSRSFLERPGSVEYRTLNILREMGFSRESSLAAIESSHSYNIDTLLNFMLKSDDAWDHDFIPDENERCTLCKDTAESHLNYKKSSLSTGSFIFSEIKEKQSLLSQKLLNDFEAFPNENLCEICFNQIQQAFHLPSCENHQFCRSCIEKYLETLISESKIDNLKCPTLECSEVFSDSDVQGVVSSRVFEKYLKFKKRHEINKDKTTKFCCQPDCEGLVQNIDGQVKQKCNICGVFICFECGLLWHAKKKCEENIDKEYKNWALGREVQSCPSCRFEIEKNEGCNHMTCAVCGFQWCWLCRGKYTSNHFNSLNPFGCPNMQFGEVRRSRWLRFRILCKRLKICLVWIFLLVLSPLLIIFGPSLFLFHQINNNSTRTIRQMFGRCGALTIFLAVGVFSPVIYAFLALFLIVFLIKSCFGFLFKRRRNRFRSSSLLYV